MNIYDFDKTIYDGDSSVDFFKYCIKRNKKVLLTLPYILWGMILYYLNIKEKEYFKSCFFSFVKYFDNIDKEVMNFWKINKNKIKKLYKENHDSTDIIISASPEFLLKPISKIEDFKLIGSKVDKKTGKFTGKNCYGKEKVVRLKEIGVLKCNKFYSDSLSDTPVKNISKHSFIVKKDNLIEWDNYKPSFISKLKHFIFDRHFITFIFIGIINVFNGVWIALLYSNFIENSILAYILGFLTSLCISYILNSLLNFKEKLSFTNLYRFAISNIPNFIIQVLTVFIFIDLLKCQKLISYFISAVIAVPITYILVKTKVFKKSI